MSVFCSIIIHHNTAVHYWIYSVKHTATSKVIRLPNELLLWAGIFYWIKTCMNQLEGITNEFPIIFVMSNLKFNTTTWSQVLKESLMKLELLRGIWTRIVKFFMIAISIHQIHSLKKKVKKSENLFLSMRKIYTLFKLYTDKYCSK